MVARAIGLASADLPGKCPVLKQLESMRVAMGENNGQSFFHAKAVAANKDVVGQIESSGRWFPGRSPFARQFQ